MRVLPLLLVLAACHTAPPEPGPVGSSHVPTVTFASRVPSAKESPRADSEHGNCRPADGPGGLEKCCKNNDPCTVAVPW